LRLVKQLLGFYVCFKPIVNMRRCAK